MFYCALHSLKYNIPLSVLPLIKLLYIKPTAKFVYNLSPLDFNMITLYLVYFSICVFQSAIGLNERYIYPQTGTVSAEKVHELPKRFILGRHAKRLLDFEN
ncbi:uncharacterized protein LOC127732076 isoform X2 [Mytilus californianus]|uniref:uncharacterized protein LOC127732076 isoform X2 n=1 Tax=Mytilus californianus TaxID=6549 RepID=UPI002245EC60|nr:uncharacterized protein LOC127732076 isoform X2 [Mytilus californianus]